MPQDMRDIVLILQHDSVSWAKLGKDLLWMIFHFPGGYPTLSTSYLSTGSSLYSRMQNDVWALPAQKATKLQTYSHPCETGNTWRWVAASLGCCRFWVLEWLEPSPAEEAVLLEHGWCPELSLGCSSRDGSLLAAPAPPADTQRGNADCVCSWGTAQSHLCHHNSFISLIVLWSEGRGSSANLPLCFGWNYAFLLSAWNLKVRQNMPLNLFITFRGFPVLEQTPVVLLWEFQIMQQDCKHIHLTLLRTPDLHRENILIC